MNYHDCTCRKYSSEVTVIKEWTVSWNWEGLSRAKHHTWTSHPKRPYQNTDYVKPGTKPLLPTKFDDDEIHIGQFAIWPRHLTKSPT